MGAVDTAAGDGDRADTDGQAEAPRLVTLHVWGVPASRIPLALGRMAADHVLLRRQPATFTKLLGTGSGRTFRVRDADLRHWALLATWPDDGSAAAFEHSATARGWRRIADEQLVVQMAPLASRGRWSATTPFGASRHRPRRRNRPTQDDVPVASITRARIRPTKMRTFWRAVPPVSRDLHSVDGLRLAIGIGEAPLGLQGTFSIWRDAGALTAFASGREAHRTVVRRTAREDWYAEELFARFRVLSVHGTYRGRTP
ncbi:MAG: monooxygenase [Actinomycetes bacterium]